MNYMTSCAIVVTFFFAHSGNGMSTGESVLKTVYSLDLVPISEYTSPEIYYPFFNLSARVRKQKCIDALKLTRFPSPLQDVDFYVPKAHIYNNRDNTRSDGHPTLVVLIRCPTLPPLYLVDGSTDILVDPFPFLYQFHLETVKSIATLNDHDLSIERVKLKLVENRLYELDFRNRWRLCNEAMKYIAELRSFLRIDFSMMWMYLSSNILLGVKDTLQLSAQQNRLFICVVQQLTFPFLWPYK